MKAEKDVPRLTVRDRIPSVCRWIRIRHAFGSIGDAKPPSLVRPRLNRQLKPARLAMPQPVILGRAAVRQASLAQAGMQK